MTEFYVDEHKAGSGIHRGTVFDVKIVPGGRSHYRAETRSGAEAFIAGFAQGEKAERERCAHIALAIDSKRGNEKEIARAIRARN